MDQSRPLLLGLSGGPDSTALLHLLLEYKKKNILDLHVAHVDHRWRSTSTREAEELGYLAKELCLPYHLYTIKQRATSNMEDRARQERLQFFRSICQKTGSQAVVLAHQADDLAETVLKRLLEGSAITNLVGLKAVVEWKAMAIWRPLLEIRKKEIIKYLHTQKIEYFEDFTNFDPSYLRARMRESIFPWLSVQFGKEISSTLYTVGRECEELSSYLDRRTVHYLKQVVYGREQWGIDLSSCSEVVELKYAIRSLCKEARCTLSRQILCDICHHLLKKSFDKFFYVENYCFHVHGGEFTIRRGRGGESG